MLNALGVKVDSIEHMAFPDGTLRPVDMGHAQIRLEGMQFPTSVIFAEEGEPSVLGSMALAMAVLGRGPGEQYPHTEGDQALDRKSTPEERRPGH